MPFLAPFVLHFRETPTNSNWNSIKRYVTLGRRNMVVKTASQNENEGDDEKVFRIKSKEGYFQKLFTFFEAPIIKFIYFQVYNLKSLNSNLSTNFKT